MKNLEFESYFELNYQKGDFLDKSTSDQKRCQHT